MVGAVASWLVCSTAFTYGVKGRLYTKITSSIIIAMGLVLRVSIRVRVAL